MPSVINKVANSAVSSVFGNSAKTMVLPNGRTDYPSAVGGSTLGVIGDSREDNAHGGSLTGGSPGDFWQPYRTLKWALGLAGHPFRVTADFSRAGSGCTPTMAAIHPTYQEQLSMVLAAMPTYCWVRVPINDILNGNTADQIWPYFKKIVEALIAEGIRVELVACTMLDSTKASYSSAYQAEIIKLNALVRAEYGSVKGAYGVVFHDYAHAALTQSVTTYAGITSAYQDYVHFQNVGAYLEGAPIAANWLTRFKPIPLLGKICSDAYRNVAADNSSVGSVLQSASSNYLSNGMFDLGTPASGLAQGWAVTSSSGCTYVASIVSAPSWDGNTDGNGQQFVVTWTAANGFLQFESPNMFGDIKFLKKYIAAALMTVVAGSANFKNVRMELQVSASSSAGGALTYGSTWGLLVAGDDALVIPNGYSEVALCELDLGLRPDLIAGGGNYFRLRFFISGGSGTSGSATVILSRAVARVVN